MQLVQIRAVLPIYKGVALRGSMVNVGASQDAHHLVVRT